MRHLALALFFFLPAFAFPQTVQRAAGDGPAPYQRYADSLALARAKADALFPDSLPRTGEPGFMRLFTPLGFHTDIARRRFALPGGTGAKNGDVREVDDALLRVYFNRPDLVRAYVRDELQEDKNGEIPEAVVDLPALSEAFGAPAVAEQDFEPVDLVIKKPNFWTFGGDLYLQAVQNYYSDNWYQGLESNYAWLTKVTLQANYNNKQKVTWDNKLEMNIGFQTDKSDEVHKIRTSEDLLRYTTMVGLQATKKWYYTFQTIAATQFMRTFPSNSTEVSSSFLSPLSVNASIGMSYKFSLAGDKLSGSVYLSPAALGFKYVDRLSLASANGVDEGRHSLVDFGYTFTVEGTWNFNDYISWQTRLYAYSPYDRVELQWENTVTIKVSRIIAVSLYAYPRFDDSPGIGRDEKFGYFQLKEYTSFGLTYSF